MKRFFLVVLVLVGVALGSCATIDSVPLPQTVQIVSPDPGLPPEIKAFSGKWGGVWWCYSCVGGPNAVLIVERITGEQAVAVIYGAETNIIWGIQGGWYRLTTNFSRNKEGELILSWVSPVSGLKFEFRVKGDKLEGIVGTRPSYITMKRL